MDNNKMEMGHSRVRSPRSLLSIVGWVLLLALFTLVVGTIAVYVVSLSMASKRIQGQIPYTSGVNAAKRILEYERRLGEWPSDAQILEWLNIERNKLRIEVRRGTTLEARVETPGSRVRVVRIVVRAPSGDPGNPERWAWVEDPPGMGLGAPPTPAQLQANPGYDAALQRGLAEVVESGALQGQRGTEALFAILESEEPAPVRLAAAKALGTRPSRFRDTRCALALARALGREDNGRLHHLVLALAPPLTPDGRTVLEALARSFDQQVSEAALRSLVHVDATALDRHWRAVFERSWGSGEKRVADFLLIHKRPEDRRILEEAYQAWPYRESLQELRSRWDSLPKIGTQ